MIPPQQLSLDLVEPLTVQLKLPLDYSNCERLTLTSSAYSNAVLTVPAGGSGVTWSSSFEVDNFTMKYDEEPNVIRRWLLKMLGIKWKMKK